MNHIYRVLWNKALGRFCVTSELGRSRSRPTTRRSAGARGHSRPGLAALTASVALAWGASAWGASAWGASPAGPQALPHGPHVLSGSVAVTQAGSQMTVLQGSPKAIVDWQSFNIGANHQVTFQQPGSASVALNRVVGGEASAIHGRLQANGQVFLVNPNGMLFGAGANINVGGLVASTLNIADHDFLQGNYQFNGQGSGVQGAAIAQQGRITAADGGAVALLGGSVSNQGTIAARLGSVALAAGNQVKLDFAGDGLLNVQVQQSSLNALVENHQLIQADGGSVLMTAKATDALLQTVVNNTGTVRARTVENRAGRIVLLGGFNGGTARIAGMLDASAPDTGHGGFIETSGAHVQITAGTRVTTQAAQGKTGTWLIDPTDMTISAGDAPQSSSGIGANTLQDGLGANNVVLQTLGEGIQAGDIHVNAPVSWNRNQLTLNAHGSINVNAPMSVNGSGTLALNYGNTQGNAATVPVALSNLNVNAGGRVDFADKGAGLLSVNGHGYAVINTLAELQDMGNAAQLGGKFALGGSIDASATKEAHGGLGFAPIGGSEASFTGVFDGLGHTIGNLHIKRSVQDYVGLFGAAKGATLRNIGLVGGSATGQNYSGGLAGYQVASSISNAYTTGSVEGSTYVGGLVGYQLNGSITNAYTTGSVEGVYSIGGLVGSQEGAGISNAYTAGNVMGRDRVGGLVGLQSRSTISYAYTTGSVTKDIHSGSVHSGGLVGYQFGGSISNAYTTGNVEGTDFVGGLVGLQNSGSISNASTTGNVDGAHSVGGLVGYRTGSSSNISINISNTFTTGNVTGDDRVGGLIGYQAGGSISNAYTTGSVKGSNDVGGLVGYQVSGSISNAYTTGSVTGRDNVGGLAGYQAGGSISNAYTAGSVTGSDNVGGMVGYQAGGSISNIFTTGNVGGTNYVGGLVGYQGISNIRDAYTTGSVTGANRVGGLVGSQSGSISNAYATGSVTGTYFAGGLVGFGPSGSTHNSYWNIETTGQSTSAGGIGLTTAEMFDTSLWGNFDFGAEWGNAKGQTTPYLLNLAGNQVFNKNDLPTNPITATIRPGLYTAVLDAQQLQAAQSNLAGRYLLGKDIDASATAGWNGTRGLEPIGSNAAAFTGIFDGLGHTVSNLAIVRPDETNIGLFGYASGATLRNIGLVGGSVKGFWGVGGLVGVQAGGSISNAYTTGSVEGTQHVGGLVGYQASGTISNAYTTGSVEGTNRIGGLVGYQLSGSISNAFTTGTVKGFQHVGGLVSEQYNGSISNAYTTGSVTGYLDVGGLVGLQNGGSISNAYTTASVTGADRVGGLVGNRAGGSIDNTYATGRVTAASNAGGLVGFRQIGSTHSSYWNIETTGQSTSAGGTGLTSAQMQRMASFAGWSITDQGGSNAVWRIYEGQTTPLLRSFLTAVTIDTGTQLTREYNGSTMHDHVDYKKPTVGNTSQLLGTLNYKAAEKNVGTYSGAALSLSGLYSSQQGYDISYMEAAGTLVVTKAQITSVGIRANNKPYDGTRSVTLDPSGATFQGRIGDDVLSVAGATGRFSDKNAGDGKAVDITGITLAGADAGNYTLAKATAQTRANIARLDIAASVTAQHKTYDGHAGATTQGTLDAVLGSDLVTLATNGSFADRNAGSGKTVTVRGTLQGADAGNYRLVHNATTTANIDPRAINASITAHDKPYDGSTRATTQGTLAGVLGGDRVTLQTSGSFSDKNAGVGKTVDITGITLVGADAGNYTLASTSATTTANIAKASIESVGGITADNKTYDGTRSATLDPSGATFQGRIGDDVLSVAGAAGRFSDKNAGDGKRVDITGIALAGADAGNYTLVKATAQTRANIAKADLTAVGGIRAGNKTYDGTRSVTLDPSGATFQGRIGDDVLSVAGATGRFSDKNAGDGKAVDITGIALAGADAGNYILVNATAQTRANIAKADLTAVAGIRAGNKTYDGTRSVTLDPSGATFQGRIGDDVLSVAGATGRFSDKNAGDGKRVDITGITLAGADAGNYTMANARAQTSAHIAKADLTAVAGIRAGNKTYDGTRSVTLDPSGATFQGRFGDDVLSVAGATGRFSNKNAGDGKAVDITGITLAGADAGNYTLAKATAQTRANIARLDIAASVTAQHKTYDGHAGATTQGTLDAVLGSDLVTLATNGSFADRNAGSGKTVTVSGTLQGADAGNYRLVHNATTTANIDPLTINASITAHDKPYDGSTRATTQGTLAGVLGGDRVTLQASGSFSDAAVGDSKTVLVSGVLAGVDAGNYRLVRNATATAAIQAVNVDPGTAPVMGVPIEVHASLDDKGLGLAGRSRGTPPSAQGCFSEAEELTHRSVNLNASGIPVDRQALAGAPRRAFAVVGGPAHSRACPTAPITAPLS